EWVGWKNTTRQGQPVEITFEFDSVRNFSAVHIYANNLFTKDSQVFSHARVLFSMGGEHFHAQEAVEYEYVVDRIFEYARNVTIRLHNAAARYIKLQLYFALKWIMISEVSFDSVPCHCNLTDEDVTLSVSTEKMNEERFVEERISVVPAEETSALLLGGLICVALIFG
ncbi:hypothetical protein OTU49_014145, partial [Cherax quadricarinatus]